MNTQNLAISSTSLGGFLRDRRALLQPQADKVRRRTPGLRREEVAARAGVSVTWYTWLEQGRGGQPSADVIERLASALELDAAGREFLFLLAQKPAPRAAPTPYEVPASLQLILDSMPITAAVVKTPAWDVVAWNHAARFVLGDYDALPAGRRNVLRVMFTDPNVRTRLPFWEEEARFGLEVFRIDVARSPDSPEALALVAELEESSADFRRLWAESSVRTHWAGTKTMIHPTIGTLRLTYSSFAVDGADGLTLILYAPATAADTKAVTELLAANPR